MKKKLKIAKRVFMVIVLGIMAYVLTYQACITLDTKEPKSLQDYGETATTNEYSTVSITQSYEANASDLDQAEILTLVREAVKLAGGFSELVTGAASVVLKPNLVKDIDYTKPGWHGDLLSEFVNGCCTDWRVTHAVATLVREINTTCKLYIMEGSSGDTATYMKNLGYTTEHFSDITNGVILYILEDSSSFEDVNLLNSLYSANNTYHLDQVYKNATVLISIPTLKNHWSAVITGGIKNVSIGGVPGGHPEYSPYRNFIDHESIRLHQWIRDWYLCRPVDYVIMDGLQGVQNGPTPSYEINHSIKSLAPHQKNMRCILAGDDAVAVDTIEALLMTWDPSSVEYLNLLAQDGAGYNNTANIHVVGKKVDEMRENFTGKLHLQSYGGKQFDDLTPPSISITSYNLNGDTLDLAFAPKGDMYKLEILVNNQLCSIMTAGFKTISLDISDFNGINNTITANAYDFYMNHASVSVNIGNGVYHVKKTSTAPTIDGVGDEACWHTVPWTPINRLWSLAQPSSADFTGQVKIVWRGNMLYILCEITDDVLQDNTSAWYINWWNDDCLEIFIDENKSGGNHEKNENAYAYHCAINGTDVVDLDLNGNAVQYNSHINYKIVSTGTTHIWELAITVYDDSLNPIAPMSSGKEMGLSVAYCDNDGGIERESFIGTTVIDEDNKNASWKNADYFGSIILE